MNIQEIEEQEFGRSQGLWDANPDVCCAVYQTGACSHTEDFDPEETFGDPTWGEVFAALGPGS